MLEGPEPFEIHRGQKLSFTIIVHYNGSDFRYKNGETFADYGNNASTGLPPIRVTDVSDDGLIITVEVDAASPSITLTRYTYRLAAKDEVEILGTGKFKHLDVLPPFGARRLRVVEDGPYLGSADKVKSTLANWTRQGLPRKIILKKNDGSGYYLLWYERGNPYGQMFGQDGNPDELDTVSIGDMLENVIGQESRTNNEWRKIRQALNEGKTNADNEQYIGFED